MLIPALSFLVVGAWLGFTIGWALGVFTCAPHVPDPEPEPEFPGWGDT